MPAKIDLLGSVFGRLTVIADASEKGKPTRWLCRCECGDSKEVRSCHLRSGVIKDCGCIKAQQTRARMTKHGYARRGHKHPTYPIWRSAKDRCVNTRCKAYPNYGGRGVQMCDRWMHSFPHFLEDMGTRPPGMMLERVDNDGNYEPGNCIWATRKEQNRNQRRVLRLPDGELVIEAAERLGIRPDLARTRYHRSGGQSIAA